MAVRSGLFRYECLIQIVDQVFRCFQADGQPYHIGAGAGASALLIGKLAVGSGGGMQDQ